MELYAPCINKHCSEFGHRQPNGTYLCSYCNVTFTEQGVIVHSLKNDSALTLRLCGWCLVRYDRISYAHLLTDLCVCTCCNKLQRIEQTVVLTEEQIIVNGQVTIAYMYKHPMDDPNSPPRQLKAVCTASGHHLDPTIQRRLQDLENQINDDQPTERLEATGIWLEHQLDMLQTAPS